MAGWIRVTHPCAGRRRLKQASTPLPLDLHVLSLQLAFILSQDQTLHCKISCYSCEYVIICSRIRIIQYCTITRIIKVIDGSCCSLHLLKDVGLYYLLFIYKSFQRSLLCKQPSSNIVSVREALFVSRLRMQRQKLFSYPPNILVEKFLKVRFFSFNLLI